MTVLWTCSWTFSTDDADLDRRKSDLVEVPLGLVPSLPPPSSLYWRPDEDGGGRFVVESVEFFPGGSEPRAEVRLSAG